MIIYVVNIVDDMFCNNVMGNLVLSCRNKSMRHAKSRRPTLKDKKREETRAKLLAAAQRLFAEHGYDSVPVTEIAQEAGVTHSMINVYFGGKAGLLYEIVRQNNDAQYEESKEAVSRSGPTIERLSDLLLHWTKQDTSEPSLLAVMQSYSWVWPKETEMENRADRGRFLALIAELVREGQQAGELTDKILPDAAATVIFAVYTWGLRAAIFDELSAKDCHQRIMEQVKAVLAV